MFLLLAFFKLGFLANFLSKPILVGFVGGLALDILVSQIAKMLGVKIDSGGEFVDKVSGLVHRARHANVVSLLISVVSVAILLLGKRLLPAPCRGRSSCSSLGTILVMVADLDDAGVACSAPVPAGPPDADLADHRLGDVARAHPVGDRAHPGDDR